jgi:hypothetical protein
MFFAALPNPHATLNDNLLGLTILATILAIIGAAHAIKVVRQMRRDWHK